MKKLSLILAILLCPLVSQAATKPLPYLLYRMSLLEGSDRAKDYLKEALESDPQSSVLIRDSAAFAAEEGDLEKARALAEELVSKEPDSWEAQLFLGQVAKAMGDHARAIQAYEKARRLAPDQEAPLYYLVQEMAVQGQPQQGLVVLQNYQRQHPKHLGVLFFKAEILLRFLNQPTEAIQVYRDVLKIQPDNLQALSLIADIYRAQGDTKKELQALLKMEKKSPDDEALALKIGLLQYEMKDYQSAIVQFKKVRHESLGQDKLTYYLGVIYHNIGEEDKALQEFAQVAPSSVYYQDAVVHQAVIFEKQKQKDKAYAVLEQGLSARPELARLYEYKGELYREDGNDEGALQTYKAGLKKASETVKLGYALGMLYESRGDYKKAIQVMKKILKEDPDNAQALNFLGYTYADHGIKLKEAERLIIRALELKPGDAYLTDSLAWTYFKQNRMDEAYFYLMKAHQIAPQEPAILEHLGDYYAQLKENEKALDFYRQAQGLTQKTHTQSLTAVLTLRMSHGAALNGSEHLLYLKSPHQMRLDTLDPSGVLVQQIFYDGKKFLSEPPLEEGILASLNPTFLIPLLMGQTPESLLEAVSFLESKKDRYLLANGPKRCWVEKKTGRPQECTEWNESGEALSRVTLSQWKTEGIFSYPTRIEVELFSPRGQLTLEYQSVRLNPVLEEAVFQKIP